MKHKRFNEVLPYTYVVVDVKTSNKYYGVRYGNIKLGLSPNDDLGIKYFTSGSLKRSFKNSPDKFTYHIHYTFDSVEEALDYERKFLTKVYKKADWLNKTNNRSFDESKIRRNYDRKEAALKSSITMSNDVVDGLTMHQRRARKGAATRERLGITKRAAKKASITKTTKGFDGLSIAQRAARKNPHCQKGTPEAIAASRKAAITYKNRVISMTDEEFDKFCEGRSPSSIKAVTTMRNS